MSKRDVLLEALAATPGDLERLVTKVDNTLITHRPNSDEWSIADVLCHLALVEELSLARLQLVVENEQPKAASDLPSISSIHPDPTAHDLSQPLTTMLAHFQQARQATLAFLQTLKAGDWQRASLHPTRGRMTLRVLVQYLVDHDTAHLNQIVEIKVKREHTDNAD